MKRSISMDTIATFDGSISDSNGSLQLPDVSNLMDYRPLLGNEEVRPVTCTAAASKPPEEVKWLTGTLAGPSASSLLDRDGGGQGQTQSRLLTGLDYGLDI